jgi:hypothetical protein
MKKMDRRRFLIASAAAAASLKVLAQAAPQPAKLTLHLDQAGPAIPANFAGLSYEKQHLSDPNFFSAGNAGLVKQFRELTTHGVLRLGGNTSDYAVWKPTPAAVPPLAKPGDPPPNLAYNVSLDAIHNLRAFLDATGWTCFYGIKLITSTPDVAADEAASVARILGPKLDYYQVGNEADRFGVVTHDPKTWSAAAYFSEWMTFACAIGVKVPSAKFGVPDRAGDPEWYALVVNRLLALEHRPDVTLTHHYYFTGPPSNPRANLVDLLRPDPKADKLASVVRAAAAKLEDSVHRKVPYRMTEGNTCYSGGKPGFSDVFAASLWAADYLLKLASLGYAGVNMHGGEGKYVAASVGGTLPGESMIKNPNEPHPRPFYTPIADIGGKFVAEPVSFGMRFAEKFSGATIIPLDFDPGPVNATAYAARRANGELIVAVINKDATRTLKPSLAGFHGASYRLLKATSLTSTDVTWDKTEIPAGHTGHRGGQNASDGDLQFEIPPATAVLIGSLT